MLRVVGGLLLWIGLAGCTSPAVHHQPDSAEAPYGSWRSPITAEAVTRDVRVFWFPRVVDGDDFYWSEIRPEEKGRTVVVQLTPDGRMQDRTPPPYSARSHVYEYGGGGFTVDRGTVFFSNGKDGRLYRASLGGNPVGITMESAGKLRYADLSVDRRRSQLIAVREDHRGKGEPVHTIVAVDLRDGGEGKVLVSGNDFYSEPRLSPSGDRLAWRCWDHPNMPWDHSEVWIAELGPAGEVRNKRRVAGGPGESVMEIAWSPDGVLHFQSDRTGWWNLYRVVQGKVEPLAPMEAEVMWYPWFFGVFTYDFVGHDRIAMTYYKNGWARMALIDTASRSRRDLRLPFNTIMNVRASGNRLFFEGGHAALTWSLVVLDLGTGKHRIVKRELDRKMDRRYLSEPNYIRFPTVNREQAFGYFYPPRNPDFRGPPQERPPLIITVHGGPHGAATGIMQPKIQYWTSRGFAVLNINYGGSTGQGRAYRERLRHQWGIVDVEDCVAGARYLDRTGKVDGKRVVIRGISAGGYTTLMALATRGDVFRTGTSIAGLSDLELFAKHTHKLESRYLDSLVAPSGADQAKLLRLRSPIHHRDRLRTPMLILQGLEDTIVPPEQATLMVHALKKKGVPVAYLPFKGEGHMFRKARTWRRALEAELYFYGRILGFTPADRLEPIPIHNLN